MYFIDPYVRVDVWKGSKILLKKKTFVIKQELNPVYNQRVQFHLPSDDLEHLKIVLTVASYVVSPAVDSHGAVSLTLHKLEIGENSTNLCWELWNKALTAKRPIARWHTLQ